MTGDEAAPRPAPETIVSGGAAYSVRPLCSEDEGRLREFFQSHSRETVQSRYGYMISTMTRERARSLVNVDQVRDVALGVFEGAGSDQVLHAVGRYYSEEDSGGAEVAFVVRESKRRQGLATALLLRLAAAARMRGLGRFHALVLRDNRPMRSIFDRYRPSVTPSRGSDCLRYEIPIEAILAKNAPISSNSAERKRPRGS
jgi:GNAT superfamily N-acetyltransferase